MKSADRVTVSWIDPGQVDGAFLTSIVELFRARTSRLDGIVRIEGSLLSRQRNQVVSTFLDHTSAQWLFMVDSDERFPPESFDKMISAAHEKDRPVVAGLYFGTWPSPTGLFPNPVPHLYRQGPDGISVIPVVDYPQDRVIEIDAAGTGALLVHRSVLEAIRTAADPNEGAEWCWFRDLPLNGLWLGEDLYFCRRIRSLGFPIHAHTGALFDHHRTYWLDDRQHRAVRLIQEDNMTEDAKKAAEQRAAAADGDKRTIVPKPADEQRGYAVRSVDEPADD